MKNKRIGICFVVAALLLALTGCTSSSSRSRSSSYDYDKGYGYSSPKAGESFSDYVKRQDPGLYDSMTKRYN